jgi:hypothetical protein
MLLSGLELRRDDDDYGGVLWSRNVKICAFGGGKGRSKEDKKLTRSNQLEARWTRCSGANIS